jgi:diguanylate cyclase (GGDEF)-like protein
MYPVQLALLTAEALVMALLVFALFRSRAITGHSPLYVLLGGFQYLAASLALRVEVGPGWTLQPASVVMFGVTLMAVLLIYVSEQPRHTRRVIHALVVGNAGLTLVGLVVGQHLRITGAEVPLTVTSSLLLRDAVMALARATALYAFLIGLVVVYEFVSRYVTALALRAALALAVVLGIEAVVFTLLGQWGWPNLTGVLVPAVTGAVITATGLALLLAGYVQFVEPAANPTAGTGDVSDVLQELTYRQLYEQARSRMTRDALTGVHNRGYFDESFARAIAHADRYREHLSVMIADADHFKTINDRYSHLTGDKVLKLFAATLVEEARASDIVCRYGGDEFVVILPKAPLASAQAFAQRFQDRLRDRATAPEWGLAALPISATVGVASLLEDSTARTPEDLLRLADNRLYVGKRAGRDRVVWRDVPVSSVP